MLRAKLAVCLTLFLASGVAFGQEKSEENPIVATVKASVKDQTKPFTMVVTLEVKEGMGKKFEKAFAKAIKGTRKEKGNIAYQLSRNAKMPTQYMVYERWRNVEALSAHMETDHIKGLLSEIGDMLKGAPEVTVFMPAGG